MKTNREVIAAAYDAGVDEEYERLTKSPLCEAEYKLITGWIDEYIANNSTVIDIGSGPGRYAEYLLSKNCNVGICDLSQKSIDAFFMRIGNKYINQVLFSYKTCATQLECIKSEIADAVLIMGPLYHLISKKERDVAISNCYRILKNGGVLFAIFLSPFPKLNPLLEAKCDLLLNSEYIESIQNNGINVVQFKGYEIEQYRCWPNEAKKTMEMHGFSTKRICNIEGIGTFFSKEYYEELKHDIKKQQLINALRITCENPNMLGITSQYLYVGKK